MRLQSVIFFLIVEVLIKMTLWQHLYNGINSKLRSAYFKVILSGRHGYSIAAMALTTLMSSKHK
ncbi:uncharacterized protein RCO7_14038 [Rhynchosporium graminicola]|uniref:Uncharacterized protein n=1 Tax=Rhynchosporium graminicola TaxID=2792576 RepID=A0A1E1LDL9_9HELO|nr:uncharacterized protein RCO7_14038 [Rhynchosporium commune]